MALWFGSVLFLHRSGSQVAQATSSSSMSMQQRQQKKLQTDKLKLEEEVARLMEENIGMKQQGSDTVVRLVLCLL